MRILMLSDVYKPVINGVSFSIEIFSRGLRELGHKVTLVAPAFPGEEKEDGVFRLRSLTFPFHKEQRMALPFPRKTIAEVAMQNWDIVHVHTLFNMGFLGLRIARNKNVPAVFTYHTLFEEYVHYIPLPGFFMKRLAVAWSRRFSNACDAVIAPSREIRDTLARYGVTRPIAVLPTPVDPSSFDPVGEESPYTRLGLPPSAGICLYVGRIGPEKNLLFLLRAFREVARQEPEARLVIVGDGPYRPALEKTAAGLGLSHAVVFAGYVPRKELSTWFARARLFLFASLTETQGMALSEALHFGLPAVIVEGPGTREVIEQGGNGFMTPPDAEAFAGRVLLLLRDGDLRRKLAARASESAESLKPERIVDSLVELFLNVRKSKIQPGAA